VRRLGLAIGLVVLVAASAIAFLLFSTITAPPQSEDDDDFGSVDIYTVLDDGTLDPAASGLTAEVWETFTRVATVEFVSEVMSEYRVGDAPRSDTLAYVYQTDDPDYWVLADNLATSEDESQLIATLVHEYAHILTLGVDEVQPRANSCETLQLDEGCAEGDAVILAFDERFWSGYGDDAPAADNSDADLAWEFYLAHEDDFVSDYAATNVVEDIAESFMTWVVEDDASGDSVVAEKLRFFEDYPPLVAIRDRIRSEFDGELGIAG